MIKVKDTEFLKKLPKICEIDNSVSLAKEFSSTYYFVKKHPQLECLSFNSLHRIAIQKDENIRDQIIAELVYRIEHPKISDYQVQKIILEQKGKERND